MEKTGREQTRQEFRRRKNRQFTAILVTISLMLIFIWKQHHPGLFFGELSETVVSWIEIFLIAAFIGFSYFNWRCPACKHYLGKDINPKGCRRCGTRLR